MKKIQLTLEDDGCNLILSLYSNTGEKPTKKNWPEEDRFKVAPDFQMVVSFSRDFLTMAKKMIDSVKK